MSLPAVLVCEPRVASLKVVALPVLDRLLVAAHRAGCSSITVVCQGELPRLERAKALGVSFTTVGGPPAVCGPTLLASTRALAQAGDLARVMAEGGRLSAGDGSPLPVGVAARFTGSVEASIEGGPSVIAREAAALVEDRPSACRAGRVLWASLVSSTDGPMDRLLNRPLGRPLARLLVHTPVTPNQVTLACMVIGLSAAWFFSTGSHQDAILAAGLFVICTIVDCVDGDIARALFKESRLGKWLDITADQVVHVSLFVAIAVGLSRAGSDAPVLALGASAALGAVISFAVVLRGMLRPEAGRSSHLARLLDAATSRDFAYPLLLLALLDRLELFLWLAAVGSHVFWILALGAQTGGALASRTGGRTEGRERPREAHRPGSAVASRAEGKTEGAAT